MTPLWEWLCAYVCVFAMSEATVVVLNDERGGEQDLKMRTHTNTR